MFIDYFGRNTEKVVKVVFSVLERRLKLFTVYTSFELFFLALNTYITFKNINILILIETMWKVIFEGFNKLFIEVLTYIQLP